MIQVAAGNPAIPEAEHVFEPTSVARMETAISALKAAKDAWVKVGIPERIRLIDAMVERTLAEAPAWVAGAMKAKDIHPGTPLEAEDYMNGPYCVLRNLRLLKRSLQDVEKFGAPKLPGKPRKVDGGKIAAIGDSSLSYVKSGRNRVLKVPN